MDLERVAAAIRPRSPWEAVDLGFTLTRAWWRSIFPAWIVAVLPLWLVALALGRPAPAWALAALWWIKPLFDRLPLFVASRALFGATPRVGQTLAALPALSARGLWPALLRERFDPARSFHLPVGQLEGLAGAERRARAAVLGREGRGTAVMLTLACLAMEALLFASFLALAGMLLPDALDIDWGDHLGVYFQGQAPLWFHGLLGLAWFAAATLVQPFYAVAGFALYLNRRTLLEGWDVEIAFRRLARRLRAEEGALAADTRRSRRRSTAAVLALALLPALAAGARAAEGGPAATPAAAAGEALEAAEASRAEAESPASEDREAQRKIGEVLARPEFDTTRTLRRLRWRGPDLTPEGRRRPAFELPVEFLGTVLEAAGWVVAALLAAAAIVYLLRRYGALRGPTSVAGGPPAAPPVLFGLALAPQTLPPDVPAEALRRLEAGRPVEALSLLFRGALAALVARRRLEVRPSWTEGECLHHLAGLLPPEGGEFFGRLTRAWQAAAYAHRLPAPDEVRTLAAGWRSHFEAAS